MDAKTARMIEREGTAALLDSGVSVPLKEVRIPFRKKPLRLRAVMRRPRLGGPIRLSRVYLRLGVTAAEMERFTKEEEMAFIAAHGKDLSLMVAYTLCRGWLWRKLLVRPTAWWIRNMMEQRYLMACMRKFVLLLGTDPFTSIIRSAERTNPMKPRLSRRRKGS